MKHDWWYGIKGIEFIWHGEWNDPELEFDGTLINVHDIEDYFWDRYAEEGGDQYDYDAFAKWMKEHSEDVLDCARDTVVNYRETEKRKAEELEMELPF